MSHKGLNFAPVSQRSIMIIITGLTNWYHIFQRLPQHVSCWDFIVNGGTFHLRLAKHREREAVVNLS